MSSLTVNSEFAQILEDRAEAVNRKVKERLTGKSSREVMTDFCFNGQVWTCLECGRQRTWGVCQPWDPTLKPALCCEGCHDITRHAYLGLRGLHTV